jgi:UDP-glucose:(heptosyl)LPS alpha-1,3-glucosyltransferase
MRLAVCYQDVFPRRGGAETYVYDLCRGLLGAGHRVDLVATTWDESTLPAGLRTREIALTAATRAGRIWQFATRCEQLLQTHTADYDCSLGFINTWSQDILIPQGGVRAASVAANARRFRSPLVSEGYKLAKRANLRWWLYQAIERRQYDPRHGSRFVAVSRMVRDHMQKYHGIEPNRLRVIPNAIDAERLSVPDPAQARTAFRAEMGLGGACLVGLFLAHNFRLKGLDPLLEALALRQATYRDARTVHLVVCGGGSTAPYRARLRSLGLESTVHLAGFLDDVRAGFHGSDFFVLPSYYDPCSLVVFEALACGLPVITTRCNGAGELIEPGVHGEVIDHPRQVEQLAAAIDLMADDERRLAMSRRCTQLGRTQSFERHLAALLDLAEEVARSKRPRAPVRPAQAATRTGYRVRPDAAART